MKSISKFFGLCGLVGLGLTASFGSQLTAGDLTASPVGINAGTEQLQSLEAAGKKVVKTVVYKEIIIED